MNANEVIVVDESQDRDEQLRAHVMNNEVWAALRDAGGRGQIFEAPAGRFRSGEEVHLVGFAPVTSLTHGRGELLGWRKCDNGRVIVIEEYYGSSESTSLYSAKPK